jgi:hypothetical protein
VVNKVLQPMESTDPFADDFYFLQVRALIDICILCCWIKAWDFTCPHSLSGCACAICSVHEVTVHTGKFVLRPQFYISFCLALVRLQLSIKKNSAAREAAMKEQRELPNPIYVPLPVWKETKERIRMQMDATRQTFHDRSREWEQKEQVRISLLFSLMAASVG